MKMFKLINKTFFNFVICWSLLWSEVAFSNSGGGTNGSVERLVTRRGARPVRRPTPDTAKGNVDLEFDDFDTDLSTFDLLQVGGSCRSYESIDFQLNGIGGLLNHFRGKECWDSVRGDLEALPQEDGKVSATLVCETLVKVKEENKCPESFVMTPVALDLDLARLRQDPQMKQIEIDLKKKAYEEEVKKAAEVAKLQTLLSTDMDFMRSLYAKIKSAPAGQREGYMNAFGLDASFFDSDKGISLNEFVQTSFQCMQVPEEMDGFIKNPERSCAGQGQTLDNNGSSGILKSARDAYLASCNSAEDEDCPLKGLEADSSIAVADVLSANLGSQILEESSEFQNMGVLPDVNLDESLNVSRVMMDAFNHDMDPENDNRPRIEGVVNAAMNGASDQDRLNAARSAALTHTVDLIISDEGFPAKAGSEELYHSHFVGFIEFLKSISSEGTHINLSSYRFQEIGMMLEEYYKSGTNNGVRLYASADQTASAHSTSEERTLAVTQMTRLVRRAVAGQRMGDYLASKRRLEERAMGGRTPAGQRPGMKRRGGIVEFNEAARGILRNPDIELSKRQAKELVGQMSNSEIARSLPIINAAAGMVASDSFYEGELAQVAGYADITDLFMKVAGEKMGELGADSTRAAREQAKRLARLDFLHRMAIRSAQNCKSFKNNARLKHRFCSPLSDSEYGSNALDNILNEAKEGRSTMNTVNLALSYCSPIMAENRLRELEGGVNGVSYHRNSHVAHQEMNRICRQQASRLFCGDSCTEASVENSQIKSALEQMLGPNCSHKNAEDNSTLGISGFKAEDISGDQAPIAGKGESMMAGISKRGNDPEFRVKRGRGSTNFGPAGGNGIASSKPRRILNTEDATRKSATVNTMERSSSGMKSMRSNQVSKNFMTNAVADGSDSDQSLSEQLAPGKENLDPATQALLDRLERMEKRQAQLQEELDRSREEGEDEDSSERSALLAELNKLRSQIPELENELKKKKDVKTALAQSAQNQTPVNQSTPVQRTNFSRRSPASVSTGGGNRNTATAGATQAQVAAASNGGGGSFEDSSSVSSGVVRTGSRGSGDGSSVGSGLGGAVGGGAVLTLTQEIRDKARFFGQGVSPQEAVLEAKGPVLIPQGDGEFLMYEPELTEDGEVVTRDGEVVFKAVVRVSENGVPKADGRVPASLQKPEEIDPDYDPRRLRELDMFLNNLDAGPVLTP